MVTVNNTSPAAQDTRPRSGRSTGRAAWWRRGRAGLQPDLWGELGDAGLANTVRRIYTLCGWAQDHHGPGQVLAVTSAVSGEGKSSTARAVAIATARDHRRDVLLLECDLLNPNISDDFGAEAGPGLTEILGGAAGLDEGLRPTGIPNLWLLPAGARHENPARLLRSGEMSTLLDEVRRRFAFVIVDLPAVLATSDAAVLARQADGAVFVVRANTTDQRAIHQALQLLSGVALHGVVLNRGQSKMPDIVRRIVEL